MWPMPKQMPKTPAMLRWEKLSGIQVEEVIGRWGKDLESPKDLAKALSEAGPRVTEGTAYLWLKRWEHWQSYLDSYGASQVLEPQ